MIIIRDEQIIAAIKILKNWNIFPMSFFGACYQLMSSGLLSKQILWQSSSSKEDFEQLVKTQSSYFKIEDNNIVCSRQNSNDYYKAFLETLDKGTQTQLAKYVAYVLAKVEPYLPSN